MNAKKVHIVSNVIIVVMLLTLGFFAFGGGEIKSVFGEEYEKPIYQGNTSCKQVSLMINVYWGTEYIAPMLKILKKYNAKCTFFIGGSWATENNATLKLINENGHEIANHGTLHKDHKKLSEAQNFNEIMVNHNLIKQILGQEMKLFAPPSGSFSNTTLKVCKKQNYKMIMWSKDTIDWRDKDKMLIFKRATNKLKAGDLILMHPTSCTLEALEDILKFYNENGFKAVTVSQNISNVI
ncbi:MAG: polysaccharide deacetylase family protein [Clostridia bacterium]